MASIKRIQDAIVAHKKATAFFMFVLFLISIPAIVVASVSFNRISNIKEVTTIHNTTTTINNTTTLIPDTSGNARYLTFTSVMQFSSYSSLTTTTAGSVFTSFTLNTSFYIVEDMVDITLNPFTVNATGVTYVSTNTTAIPSYFRPRSHIDGSATRLSFPIYMCIDETTTFSSTLSVRDGRLVISKGVDGSAFNATSSIRTGVCHETSNQIRFNYRYFQDFGNI